MTDKETAKAAYSARINGYFTVIFNDMVSEVEVNLIYTYLKGKFNNFYADSITCGRHSVNVNMNYVTNDPYLGLDAFFDQIKALAPSKIAHVVSEDGLVILGEDE